MVKSVVKMKVEEVSVMVESSDDADTEDVIGDSVVGTSVDKVSVTELDEGSVDKIEVRSVESVKEDGSVVESEVDDK